MLKHASLAFFAATGMLLSACASAPETRATPLPGAALPKAQLEKLVNLDPDMAKIYIVRDYIIPTGLKAKISIGDQKLGSLKNGQYFETYVEPGDHVLDLSFSKIFMVRGQSQNISVEGGETYAWLIENSLGVGGAFMTRTQNVRIKYFDPTKNPSEIFALDKVESKK
ncbi:MAG: DUF2846 domain-containing protein [Litorimonas sp.]